VSNYKQPQDKTAAYLSRDGKWLKMDKESVRRVCGRPRLRNTAKLAFFGLQPYFHDGDGLLLHPLEHVAQEIGTTKKKLSEDIDILLEIGLLRRTKSGLLYDPVSYKLITKKEEPADAEFCKISQDSAKFGENLHSSPGQIAALDQIRPSFSDASNAASEKRRDLNHTEEETGTGDGSRALPSRFPFLSVEEVESVRVANINLDWPDVCAKFIAANEKTIVKLVNRKWFETFVVGYIKRLNTANPAATSKPKATKQAAAEPEPEESAELPKLEFKNCDLSLQLEGVSEKDRKEYGWFIADKKIADWGLKSPFVRSCRSMPSGDFEECRKYLLKLTAGNKVPDWDVKDALLRFSGDHSRPFYVLFAETNWDDDGFDPIGWSGIKTAEEAAEKEKAA
jgi:hypothetical protein